MPEQTLQFVQTQTTLLTELQAIERLGLVDRPNPVGAIKWLVRCKRLRCVKVGRGIRRYHPDEVTKFIDTHGS